MLLAIARRMRGNYIDLISGYCDRWCQRCAFTDRCSLHAVETAIAMCDGDLRAAVELAVGVPAGVAPAAQREPLGDPALAAEDPVQVPGDEDFERRHEEIEDRLDESPLTVGARRVGLLAHAWFAAHRGLHSQATGLLKDAVEVVGWDRWFIAARLRRALRARELDRLEGGLDEYPIQNDWNGSAKVALISIRRSADAWETIGHCSGEPEPMLIARELQQLAALVEEEFPDSWKFVRPGFDEAGGARP